MERLGWWLCAGLAKLDAFGAAEAAEATQGVGAIDMDPDDASFSGVLRESRIAYPLAVDAWQAVGEHLFEEEEDGVSVRYVHGADRDRWIDVYFYPAGALDESQLLESARSEAALIREAHVQAGYTGFDLGDLRSFSCARDGDARLQGAELDLAYGIDGVRYSSAMTLLLDRLHFVKGRYSIEESRLSRCDVREQLQAFMVRLQARLAIDNVGDDDASWAGQQCDAGAGLPTAAGNRTDGAQIAGDMREIRLEYCGSGSGRMSAQHPLTVEPSMDGCANTTCDAGVRDAPRVTG